MLDKGIPNEPADWPEGVLARLQEFCQGDVVRNPPLFYWADPSKPIWSETMRYSADSMGPEVIEAAELVPPYGLVLSQTCDIREDDAKRPLRPWVQIAPIFEWSGHKGLRKSLESGRGPMFYVHVPCIPEDGFWVADLRIDVPVEKGWLATAERLEGFDCEEDQLAVGQRAGWLRSRPAFSQGFVATIIRPLRNALSELKEGDEELYAEVTSTIVEAGMLTDDLLRPSRCQIWFLASKPCPGSVRDWLLAWNNDRIAPAAEFEILVQEPEVRDFDELTAAEYLRLVPVLKFGLNS